MTKLLFSILLITSFSSFFSQKVIDQIVAVVGDKSILLSDIETQKLQALQQGIEVTEETSCMVLDELMFQPIQASL